MASHAILGPPGGTTCHGHVRRRAAPTLPVDSRRPVGWLTGTLAAVVKSLPRDRPFRPGEVGVSSRDLRRAGAQRVLCGVWVLPEVRVDHGVRAQAAALLLPAAAAATSWTAAWLLGMNVLPHRDSDVVFEYPRSRQPQAPGRAGDSGQGRGCPGGAAARPALRVGVPGSDRRPAPPAARRRGGAGRRAAAAAHPCGSVRRAGAGRHRAGHERAREVLALSDVEAQSPMETRLRLLLVDAGLPRPVAQYSVLDSGGGWLATADLAYPQLRLALEYDGAVHWTSRRDAYDRDRDRLLVAEGWGGAPPHPVRHLRLARSHHRSGPGGPDEGHAPVRRLSLQSSPQHEG